MKKLLLLISTVLLSITLSATLYEKESIQAGMQQIEQVSACVDKKDGDPCEYTHIKKIECNPILIGGALNPCNIIETGTHKITGICREKAYEGGASIDSRLVCQRTTTK